MENEQAKMLVDAVVEYLARRDSIERDTRYPESIRLWAGYVHSTTGIREALRRLGIYMDEQPWGRDGE